MLKIGRSSFRREVVTREEFEEPLQVRARCGLC